MERPDGIIRRATQYNTPCKGSECEAFNGRMNGVRCRELLPTGLHRHFRVANDVLSNTDCTKFSKAEILGFWHVILNFFLRLLDVSEFIVYLSCTQFEGKSSVTARTCLSYKSLRGCSFCALYANSVSYGR